MLAEKMKLLLMTKKLPISWIITFQVARAEPDKQFEKLCNVIDQNFWKLRQKLFLVFFSLGEI